MKRVHIVFILALWPCILFADSSPSLLTHIRHKIASIKAALKHDHHQRHHLQTELRDNELRASKINKNLIKTRTSLLHQSALLHVLQSSQHHYQKQLMQQKQALERQALAAYQFGRQPYLKVLLNQENGNRTSRLLMYYQYINQQRIRIITDLNTTLSHIKDNQEKIHVQSKTLLQLQHQQQNEKNKLQATHSTRQRLIQKISRTIKTRKQRLTQLIENQRRLEQTVTNLTQHVQRHAFGHFASARGRLTWPTHGHVLRLFGTQIEQSELRWGGVLIKAPAGRPVYAVAQGKVVFAKWLPGYGLLMIINHGSGYMTLYGRNRALYKKTGDTVNAGDLIATVGQSGGYDNPALYFAIRHNGTSINPLNWCRSSTGDSHA